jgi:integrase
LQKKPLELEKKGEILRIKSIRDFVKNGKLNLDYYLDDGTRHRFSTGMTDNSINRKKLKRDKESLVQEHYDRIRPSDAKTLFSEIALEALRSTSSDRGEETQLDYEGLYNRSLLPFFGKMTIGSIKPMHIEKWKSGVIAEGLSKSRFHKYWGVLNMIMKYLTKNEMIEKNPMLLVERASKALKPSTNRSQKYYTQKEVNAILEHSQGWFKALMHTLFMTGMRTGEALALQWKFINFEKKKITIAHSVKKAKLKTTKTDRERTIDMSTQLHEALQVHYKNRLSDEFVFPSSKRCVKTKKYVPYHGSNSVVRNHLKPLLLRLGIEYKTIYATRHSFASNLIMVNAPITYVQQMLGHEKLETTMIYIKNGLIDSSEMAPMLDSMYGT